MKPFYVDIEGLTDEEVVEIYERAITNGAERGEGIRCRGDYEHFGVDQDSSKTWFFLDETSYGTHNKLTLQQVREQYPLPTDKKVLTPRDLACFQQVADVIGEEAAEIELGNVLVVSNPESEDLQAAFGWSTTLQGWDFWDNINRGEMPVWRSEVNSDQSDSKVSDVVENVPMAHIPMTHIEVLKANKKILILGMGRHGKDSMAEHLLNQYGYTFSSSSEFAAKTFIFDSLKDVLDYSTWQECFEDRHNHRALWHELIRAYTKENPSRLAEEVLAAGNDIYVGMRSDIEVNCCIEKGLFDLIIWVDAEERLGITEGDCSMTVPKNMADIIITNNTTREDFKWKLNNLMRVIR